VHSVQVHAELRVAILIRRARDKVNLSSTSSMNPRIVFKGEQIGHSVMVGEAGIGSGAKVAFMYEDAEYEEL